MRFRKLIRSIWVFACIYLLLLATLAAVGRAQSNRVEPSAEVRNKLFKQVMAGMDEFRECVQQADGGDSAAQENAYIEAKAFGIPFKVRGSTIKRSDTKNYVETR